MAKPTQHTKGALQRGLGMSPDDHTRVRQALYEIDVACPDNYEAEYLQRLYALWMRAHSAPVKEDRTGVGRFSEFGGYLRHFTGGYGPAFMLSKRVFAKGVFAELAWFLRGETNIQALLDEDVHIWDEWADVNGNLGPIYGHNWRNLGGACARKQPVPRLSDGVDATYLGVANGKGKSASALGKTWEGMIARCYDRNSSSFSGYGARGVHVCDRWLEFKNFEADAALLEGWDLKVSSPDAFAVQLDKDLLGDGFKYSPETCKWVTAEDNAAGKPKHKYTLEREGVFYAFTSISAFCRDQGVSSGNISDLWTGRKNAQLRHGFRLVNVEDLQPKPIDQIHAMLLRCLNNQHDSGNIVSAWNVYDLDDMALRPCHTLWQICVQDGRLDLMLYQRSADWLLGVPFNAACYTSLQILLAHVLGLEPGVFHHYFGDTHLYANQVEAAGEHLNRLGRPARAQMGVFSPVAAVTESPPRPRLEILNVPTLAEQPLTPDIFKQIKASDFVLSSYNPEPVIKAQVAV